MKKKVFLLKAGQIANRMFCIESGLILCYRNVEDKKIVSGLRKEGDFLIPADFYSQTRSPEYILTLENCTLYTLNHSYIQSALRDFPEFNFHMRVLLENNARFTEEFLHILRAHNAYAKYRWLIEHFSDLSKRVPAKHLASFIGITEQSLNRIKRESASY